MKRSRQKNEYEKEDEDILQKRKRAKKMIQKNKKKLEKESLTINQIAHQLAEHSSIYTKIQNLRNTKCFFCEKKIKVPLQAFENNFNENYKDWLCKHHKDIKECFAIELDENKELCDLFMRDVPHYNKAIQFKELPDSFTMEKAKKILGLKDEGVVKIEKYDSYLGNVNFRIVIKEKTKFDDILKKDGKEIDNIRMYISEIKSDE